MLVLAFQIDTEFFEKESSIFYDLIAIITICKIHYH